MAKIIIGLACGGIIVVFARIEVLKSRVSSSDHNEDRTSNRLSVQQSSPFDAIISGRASDEPVGVEKMELVREGERAGNLDIEIENKSEKTISFVRYWLLPMPCRQYNTGNLFLDYGQKSSSTKGSEDSGSQLLPHQKGSLEVSKKDLDRYLKPNVPASADCQLDDPEEKPHLYLREVRFSDGTVWDVSKKLVSLDGGPMPCRWLC